MADFAKLTAISILGMILAVTVRRQSPELAILTSLAAGICILIATSLIVIIIASRKRKK